MKSTENRSEVALRRILWRLGFRYRTYYAALAGKPDLVFPKWKAIVFVDGDYWHGRLLIERGRRALGATFHPSKRKWWVEKISATVKRDQRITRELERQGWRVLRLWETDVRANAIGAAIQVAKFLTGT